MVKLDIRLIAATNRNLDEEARAGRFRQGLYYRPNVLMLKTPARGGQAARRQSELSVPADAELIIVVR